MKTLLLKNTGLGVVILSISILAFVLRMLAVSNIPDGQFSGSDAYFYYDLAKDIEEQGHLPSIDRDRWVPQGRDLSQTLPFYSYALAYTHKAIGSVFPKFSVYHVCLYAPAVCFVIGLSVLCLFISHTYGSLFSIFVGVLLATLPGSLSRSHAGFSDRDAWCLMLGILAVVTYLVSLQAETPRKRLIWTFVSGFIVFLGGLSWEGFGVFLSVILVVEVWRFLTSETEEGLVPYAVWVCCFVPTLYLASPAYRNGYGFAEHLAAFVLMPPLVLLSMRALRHLFLSRVEVLRPHARTLSLGLTIASLALALGYILIQFDTFASTTLTFNSSQLMKTVNELKPPEYKHWVSLYGGVFLCGSLGVILSAINHWRTLGISIAVPLALFGIATFFRGPMVALFGQTHGNILFCVAIASTLIGYLFTAWARQDSTENEWGTVAFLAWFIFWGSLARDASRHAFFIGPAIAIFAAAFIQTLANTLSCNIRNPKYTTDTFREHVPHAFLKNSISAALFFLLLFWQPIGGHARNLFNEAKHIRRATPGPTELAETYDWMKAKLPNDTVIAASWNYGGQLNVLGGVKTITDPDHFLPHWIHLYYRHVFCATSEREALEFLKTHNATHLMLTTDDVLKNALTYSSVGSNEKGDRLFQRTRLKISRTASGKPWRLSDPENTPFADIEAPSHITTTSVKARLKNGTTVKLPCIAYSESLDKISPLFMDQIENPYGGILCVYSKHDKYLNLEKASYISPKSWNSLALRLFMRDTHSEAFTQIYPIDENIAPRVKLWHIHYPPDIQTDPKYLKTGFPEIDEELGLQ